MLGEVKMDIVQNILQKMGPKNKKDIKKWRKQEKDKQEAIGIAFKVNGIPTSNDTVEKLEK